MWPNRRLLDLIGIELPIIQAPLAAGNGPAMAIAASEAGGLGSLPCGMLDAAKARAEIGVMRQRTTKPLNVNFFCHIPPEPDPDRDAAWKERLAAYYTELGVDATASAPAGTPPPPRPHLGKTPARMGQQPLPPWHVLNDKPSSMRMPQRQSP